MPHRMPILTACLLSLLVALPALAAQDPRDPVAEPASADCAAAVGGDVLPALVLPGDELREDRIYPPCTITKYCSTGGSVSCSSNGGQSTCSYGFESCTTYDGCAGSKLYVQCDLQRYYCGCAKTQTNCPPEPSCQGGKACHFNSECGTGSCVNRRCICPF
jgi:hypothetical protein